MEIRWSFLPVRVQHFLDAALEEGEMTAAAATACRLYGDSTVLTDLLRDDDWRGIRSRRVRAIAAENYGIDLIKRLPPARGDALLAMGILSLTRATRELVPVLCAWNFEDSTKGGCLLPFRRHWRLTRSDELPPKTARRLKSPRAIRRYVERSVEVRHLRILAAGIFDSIKGRTFNLDCWQAEWRDVVADLNEQRQLASLLVEDDIEQPDGGIPAADINLAHHVVPAIETRRQRRSRRRSMIKAATLAAALVGTATVSAFARGEAVTIRGEKFSISAQRTAWLWWMGHGAIQVGIVANDGRRLAGLCVYQDKTPALDQLATLALYASAGDEESVLAAGNLYAIEPDAHSDPLFAGRRETTLRPAGIPGASEDAFNLSRALYVRQMTPLYEREAMTRVFGRLAGPAQRLADELRRRADQQRDIP